MNENKENVKFSIDDDLFLFHDNEFSIFQACLVNGIYLPRFCYHNKLKIAGNCRICLVEDPKSLKPIIACASLINNEQEVFTQTSLVKLAQEGVIEYLLINHPLDCPICDQGGECDLQDQTMVYGSDKGRYYELKKRSIENVNYGPLIKFTLTRCIHCARCTRFLSDIAGYNFLTFVNRGYFSQISAYVDGFLTSELSGNIIDLCPVGALTSKPYAFTART
jgi:NADH dehydrogenase/NADH:ubiquinone oxidoreductase subunit G